jgi:lipoprotein NlpD
MALSLFGCADQHPARVATVNPNIKRTPPKHNAKPELKTKYGRTAYSRPKPAKNAPQSAPKQALNPTAATQPETQKKAPDNGKLAWGWPAQGTILKRYTVSNNSLKGIEIGGSEGAPIFAAGEGEVVYSGNSLRGYGNLIIIKHKKNFLTAYAHNHKNMVKEGETVKLGQRIAEMGQTGTDRVKLHFEIRYQGKPIDPQGVLPSR